MRNDVIHKMNSDSDIRDFLSKEYESGYKKSGYRGSSYLRKEIEKLQQELENAKKYEAALSLIYSRGWKVYDISDYISDYNPDKFFPFVGTEEEYKFLIDQE